MIDVPQIVHSEAPRWGRSFLAVFAGFVTVVTLPLHLGPAWYPILIALTALPCAWLGGRLALRGDAPPESGASAV